MTVAQLIAHLEELPQNAVITASIRYANSGYYEEVNTKAEADVEVYESVDNEVVIAFDC